jgi:hypothetical protein
MILLIFADRASLSILPLRGIHFISWFCVKTKPPLMGFFTTLVITIIVIALQSFKEHKVWFFSFEKNFPP